MIRKYGFTLLESSIVLIIIALLIAGVVSATALKRTSQLQAMLGEYDSYVKAIGEFRDKYQALPGDMKGTAPYDPQTMWGLDPCGSCPCAASTSTPIAATCNGDGNGSIGNSDSNGNLGNSYEWFRAWQQLSDAGFITGKFTGTPGPGGLLHQEATIGVNVPASALSGAGWTLLYFLNSTGGSNLLWPDNYGHILAFGAAVTGDYTYGAVLTAQDAYALDSKMDDGKPGTGKLRAWRTSRLANCTTSDLAQTSQAYVSGGTKPACSLAFVPGF